MRLMLLTVALLLTAACGQKGPLYLPVPGEEESPADACRLCPPLIMPAPADGNANGDSAPAKKSRTKTPTEPPTVEPQESTP